MQRAFATALALVKFVRTRCNDVAASWELCALRQRNRDWNNGAGNLRASNTRSTPAREPARVVKIFCYKYYANTGGRGYRPALFRCRVLFLRRARDRCALCFRALRSRRNRGVGVSLTPAITSRFERLLFSVSRNVPSDVWDEHKLRGVNYFYDHARDSRYAVTLLVPLATYAHTFFARIRRNYISTLWLRSWYAFISSEKKNFTKIKMERIEIKRGKTQRWSYEIGGRIKIHCQ